MTEARPQLRRLAEHYGILDRYERTDGKWHETSDATRVALLAAMDIDAASEESCAQWLATEEARMASRVLEPVRVVLEGSHELAMLTIRVSHPSDEPLHWNLEVVHEDGLTQNFDGSIEALPSPFSPQIEIATPMLQELPLGYHTLHWRSFGALESAAAQRLIVAPARCYTVSEKIGEAKALGIWCNLYSLRSDENWGIGDFADLRRLIEFCAANGVDFIGINPLHALSLPDTDGCPYFPTSRLYRNFLYLNVFDIPEFATCAAAQSLYASDEFQTELADLRSATHLHYSRLFALKLSVLKLLHQEFLRAHDHGGTVRGQAYAAYLEHEGKHLERFAAHCAEHSTTADLQRYLQFEIARQLADLKSYAKKCGIQFGIYQDLAVGSAPDGSDTESFSRLFAVGASLGAPPDPFSDLGQEWGITPIVPQRLRENGYEFWRLLLAKNCEASGILRIDHVLGLVRQFWIPSGRPPSDGAYVRYPEQDLFRILALESQRTKTVIVGEDLGTVPPGLRDTLLSYGILRLQVLYFEKYTEHNFIHPVHYARDAFVAANTHDLAPLAGFWSTRDLDLRHQLGQIASADELATAKRLRAEELLDLARLFAEYGLLDMPHAKPDGTLDTRALVRAAYLFLARTPSRLICVSLDDLAQESDAINIPGLSPSKNHNWRRRMQRSLAALQQDQWIQDLLHELRTHLEAPK